MMGCYRELGLKKKPSRRASIVTPLPMDVDQISARSLIAGKLSCIRLGRHGKLTSSKRQPTYEELTGL